MDTTPIRPLLEQSAVLHGQLHACCNYVDLLSHLLYAADQQGLDCEFGPKQALMLLDPIQLRMDQQRDLAQDLTTAIAEAMEAMRLQSGH